MSMSKKLNSSTQGSTPNTLFKYFAKSPATISPAAGKKHKGPTEQEDSNSTQKKPKVEDAEVEKKTTTKRQLEKDFTHSDEENENTLNRKKKRRRLQIVDSDSEEENVDALKPLEDDLPEEKNKTDKDKKNGPSKSFMDKLNNLKEEPQRKKKSEKNPFDTVGPTALDEPVVWPHNKLEFLKPDKIKDSKGRRPDHPEYDPSTLHVPETFINSLSPGVRQWWVLKSQSFDCVLFFKVGKFYELYHMDADVGVNELGFTYMRGEFAHSGFPEVSYDKMASILIDRGYKVARVEQTETPDMMTERCKSLKKVSKFDKVVNREICEISNRGTRVFSAQCSITYNHQPNFMMAIVEKDNGTASSYGVCFIDTSIGDFFIGQFEDDKSCSRLLTLLSHYPPVLVITERGSASGRSQQIFRTVLSNCLKENLLNETQYWGAEKTLKYLADNLYSKNEGDNWPCVLKMMQNENDHLGLTPNDEFKLGLKALGGCIWYLKKGHLDQKVLPMSRYNLYIPPDNMQSSDELSKLAKIKSDQLLLSNKHMILDSITLSNLRITGEEHSLLSTLDSCCTKFGKRLLHHWVCSPSCDVNLIVQRQKAITDLMNDVNTLQEMRSLFSTLPDFERHLAQIHLFGNKTIVKDHPDGRAIFFEEKIYNKNKIKNFVSILKGFESVIVVPKLLSSQKSELIQHLTQLSPKGIFPDLSETIEFFKNAFNHEEAIKNGVIAPEIGVDAEYDSAEVGIQDVKDELKNYLISQEKYFGCRLAYFGSDKKRFQLEVPESNARKAGSEYVLEGQKKGTKPVRRFHTTETKELLKKMMQAEEQRNNVLKDISRRIFEKFSNHYTLWKRCIDSIAIMDVLGSLAEYARNQNQICIPEFEESSQSPFIEIEEGYHPCISLETYIPNGIVLGKTLPPLSLLTGPNMGGKSTLMRQVGLLSVMAQIGSHIPAKFCKMSIIDRIFTRLGAQDDILAGQSTFLVELNETSLILKHATKHSLVLLDELGRGTATYDGTAIAASVVHYLADLKCRTLFSTHYHNLVDYFHNDERIALGHMACMVENEDNSDPTDETVTFLYKYSDGACPKSYGFNAAKLAGMSHSIIKKAYELSKRVESEALKRKIISKLIGGEETSQVKDLIRKLNKCQF